MLKISLVGTGKTGSFVKAIIENSNDLELFKVYDSKTQIRVEDLDQADAIIMFTPANALADNLDKLTKTKTPILSGVTGFTYPENFINKLHPEQIWIQANNFSLGMNLVRHALGLLNKATDLFDDVELSLSETHHTKKLDKPSGTALSWKKWLERDVEIESVREGDVNGIHECVIETPFEKITLNHTAKSRSLFAQGAVWGAKIVTDQENIKLLSPGFYNFEDIVDQFYYNK